MADVGIVMPVYKQKPRLLRLALQSILSQTYTNYRLVIVIDGAEAEVGSIIRKMTKRDSRVTVLVHPENRGVPAALNTGFDALYTDPSILYLTWVSSDNIYYPEFLDVLRGMLAASVPEVGVAYSSFWMIDEQGKATIDQSSLERIRAYQGQGKEAMLKGHIIGVSFMYKASYAKQAGPYRLPPVEDYDYFLRLSELCDIQYTQMILMEYRENSPHSVSAALQSKERRRQWRYTFMLAKLEARVRRGIPPEMSVVFPVTRWDEGSERAYESMLDQDYDNTEVVAAIAGHCEELANNVASIPDPRLRIVGVLPDDARLAFIDALGSVRTPYVMWWPQEVALPVDALGNTMLHFRKSSPETRAVSIDFVQRIMVYRRLFDTNDPLPLHAYRTQELLEALRG